MNQIFRKNAFILCRSNKIIKTNLLSLNYRSSIFFSQKPPQHNQTPAEQDPIKQHLKAEEVKNEEFDADESSYTRNNSTLFIYSMGAFALIIGYIFMQLNVMSYDKKTATKQVNVSYTGKAQIGGTWKLINTDDKEMTERDVRGSYYLMYFGFCNCPDICPQSLYKISRALQRIRGLPEGKLIKLKTLFVSVDPDRDDSKRIQKFLSHFDPSIIGLRGKSNDDPDLKEAMRNFKIYASKIKYEQDESGELKELQNDKDVYTIDHTIITYLMDDENNYVCHLGSNMSDHDLSKTIVEKILENERQKSSKFR